MRVYLLWNKKKNELVKVFDSYESANEGRVRYRARFGDEDLLRIESEEVLELVKKGETNGTHEG